jgi:hypothetical protein
MGVQYLRQKHLRRRTLLRLELRISFWVVGEGGDGIGGQARGGNSCGLHLSSYKGRQGCTEAGCSSNRIEAREKKDAEEQDRVRAHEEAMLDLNSKMRELQELGMCLKMHGQQRGPGRPTTQSKKLRQQAMDRQQELLVCIREQQKRITILEEGQQKYKNQKENLEDEGEGEEEKKKDERDEGEEEKEEEESEESEEEDGGDEMFETESESESESDEHVGGDQGKGKRKGRSKGKKRKGKPTPKPAEPAEREPKRRRKSAAKAPSPAQPVAAAAGSSCEPSPEPLPAAEAGAEAAAVPNNDTPSKMLPPPPPAKAAPKKKESKE